MYGTSLSAILSVLYTPAVCPTDSDSLSSDPAISNGPSGQSIRVHWNPSELTKFHC